MAHTLDCFTSHSDFSLIDEGHTAKPATGYHVLCVLKEIHWALWRKYRHLSWGYYCWWLFYLGADWKFLAMVCGIDLANSQSAYIIVVHLFKGQTLRHYKRMVNHRWIKGAWTMKSNKHQNFLLNRMKVQLFKLAFVQRCTHSQGYYRCSTPLNNCW